MTILVALLRGINVGGHNKLPMKALRGIFEGQGAEDVSTYIQSGNVVFRGPREATAAFRDTLSFAIEKEFGFRPAMQIVDRTTLGRIVKNNPFDDPANDPSKVFIAFLKKRPGKSALDPVTELMANKEELHSKGPAVYFHAPAGVPRSKAAARLTRSFPSATTRNWRTCLKLKEMADALD